MAKTPRRTNLLFLPLNAVEWQIHEGDSALICHPRPCRYAKLLFPWKINLFHSCHVGISLPQETSAKIALEDAISSLCVKSADKPLLQTSNGDRSVVVPRKLKSRVLFVQ